MIAPSPRPEAQSSGTPTMPSELRAEVLNIYEQLTRSRQLLERTAVERLQHTNEKLNAVSSTTEAAATSLLEGLESALSLVDRMEPDLGETDGRKDTRDELRDQLFDLIGHLQFQDIINQQLTYASSVLQETEARLAHLARSFGGDDSMEPVAEGTGAFDPAATMDDAEARQALADALFPAVPPA